jgi:hypothetical protein
MTIDIKRLRELAEAASSIDSDGSGKSYVEYLKASGPETILALLDEIQAPQKDHATT